MKLRFIILFAAILTISGFTTLKGQCLLWETENLAALKADPESPLYSNIVDAGKFFATQRPEAVTLKSNTFSGDPHNYESLSFYTWPDPENPDGAWITRQGYINPQYKEYDFNRMLWLQSAVRHMSMAYYLTGDETYYDGIVKWLNAWFVSPDTYMYPSMNYTQVRPGENGNRGTCWGIIEGFSLVDVFEGYLLVNKIKPMDKELDRKLHAWVKDFAKWLVESPMGKMDAVQENMHSTCYDVLLYYCAAFNKDKKTMKRITGRFASERLEKQIDAHGQMPFEMNGNRVFHDHLFNLQHIVDFCVMQKRQGKDFYSQNQKVLDRAFNFLLPYMKAPETFPYAQNADWDTDISDFKIELMRMSRLNSKYSGKRIGYDADPFETELTVVR